MQQSKSGAAAASVQQTDPITITGDAVTGPDVIAVDVEDEE